MTALWCPSHSLSQFDLRPRHSCGPLPCLVPLRTQQPRAVSSIATTHNQCRGWSGPHTCTHAILAPSGCNQENGTLCPRHVPSAPQAARWWGPPGTSFCVSLCWSGQRPTDSSLVSSQLPGGALLGPHQAWKPLPQWRSGCSHTPLSGQACEHTTGHRDTLHSCTGSKTSSSLGCDKTGCGRGHRLTTGRGIPSAGPAGQRLHTDASRNTDTQAARGGFPSLASCVGNCSSAVVHRTLHITRLYRRRLRPSSRHEPRHPPWQAPDGAQRPPCLP